MLEAGKREVSAVMVAMKMFGPLYPPYITVYDAVLSSNMTQIVNLSNGIRTGVMNTQQK